MTFGGAVGGGLTLSAFGGRLLVADGAFVERHLCGLWVRCEVLKVGG